MRETVRRDRAQRMSSTDLIAAPYSSVRMRARSPPWHLSARSALGNGVTINDRAALLVPRSEPVIEFLPSESSSPRH